MNNKRKERVLESFLTSYCSEGEDGIENWFNIHRTDNRDVEINCIKLCRNCLYPPRTDSKLSAFEVLWYNRRAMGLFIRVSGKFPDHGILDDHPGL